MPIRNEYSIALRAYRCWKNKSNFQLPVDRYESWAFFIVEDGHFHYTINEISGKAGPGDIVVCPPQTDFYRRIDNDALTFHYVLFEWREELEEPEHQNREILRTLPHYRFRLHDTERFLSTMLYLRKNDTGISDFDYKLKEQFLNDLWLIYCMETHEQSDIIKLREDPVMADVKCILEQNAFEPLLIRDLANRFHLSPVQLTRRFRAAFGQNPIKYVTHLRMMKAKVLLTGTDYTIDHIAKLCGYENGFYFSRVFLRCVGINPSRYRNTHTV